MIESPEPNTLLDFREDVAGLNPVAFGKRHGEAFLLHHGSLDTLDKPERPQATRLVEGQAQGGSGAVQGSFLVFPIRQTGRSPFPNFISVGRTANNDIVIPDTSLSKFHAYIRTDGKRMLIQDAGSSNGTFVDDEPVPAKEGGDPRALSAGARVRFGRMALIYLPTEEFMGLVKMSL